MSHLRLYPHLLDTLGSELQLLVKRFCIFARYELIILSIHDEDFFAPKRVDPCAHRSCSAILSDSRNDLDGVCPFDDLQQ